MAVLATFLPARAQNFNYEFTLSLGRFSHQITFHYLDIGGSYYGSGLLQLGLMPGPALNGAGRFVLAPGNVAGTSFWADPLVVAQWWLSDDTTGEVSPSNALDLRGDPWFMPQPSGDFVPANVLNFAIPESRYGHSLVLALSAGSVYPVSQGSILGASVANAMAEPRLSRSGLKNTRPAILTVT